MIGGLSRTGRLAIAAIFCAVGGAPGLEERAEAADLGGDCCADLEERVAELEATTARKGNKKVTVQIYGKVNQATMFWDDGAEQNVYSVNNQSSSTRFGIRGKAKIGGDWSAGYQIEAESRVALSGNVNQFDDNNATEESIRMRQSNMNIKHEKYGEVRWGLNSTPTDNIVKDTNVTKLEDTYFGDIDMNRSFFLRPKGFNNAEGLSTIRWSDIARAYSNTDAFDVSTRRNGVTYLSPEWSGFSVAWGYYEDDIWSASVRYKSPKEWKTWKVGGGFAYEDFSDERIQAGGGGVASGPFPPPSSNQTFFKRDIKEWAGSFSVKHVPTGLFFYGEYSASQQDDSNTVNGGVFNHKSPPQYNGYDLQVGIQREFDMLRLGELGETSLFGGYKNLRDGISCGSNGNAGSLGRIPANCFIAANNFDSVTVNTQITGSDVTGWYLGLDQELKSAEMHLYMVYQHLDADIDLITRGDGSVTCKGTKCVSSGKLRNVPISLDDFDLVYSGARIYF
jgi:predicted porin